MMSDIIQQIRDAYAENPTKAIKLLPELFRQYDDGQIEITQNEGYANRKPGFVIFHGKVEPVQWWKQTTEISVIRAVGGTFTWEFENVYATEKEADAALAALKEREKK